MLPGVIMGGFFAIDHCSSRMLVLQGKGHEVKNKLRNDLKPTVIANWKLWVPAQFINFRMVPPHLQVNAVGLTWHADT